MFSGEGECVPFSNNLYPTGNVEDWLLEVENTMRGSLREILNRALLVYPEVTYYTVRHFKAAPLSAQNFTICVLSTNSNAMLMRFDCVILWFHFCCVTDSSYRVGVTMAWAGSYCWLPDSLD